MKTFNNLYSKIYDFQNLYLAYIKARRGKRYTPDALKYRANLETNLITLQNELVWKTYRTGEYKTFYVYEPKVRMVAALPFKDRVLQHALCNIIEPIHEARFIKDSYACRPGKGIHAGANRAQYFMRVVKRQGPLFCLKGDIAQYFPSVDHNVLKNLLRKHIVCADTLWLCDEIINSASSLSGCPKGMPIGNLTSQLFANIYLHELDIFMKQDLKERCYVRYMDDFVVFANSKTHLQDIRKKLTGFLEDELKLKMNGKTQVFPVKSRSVDFLGYRMWPTHRLLRKTSKIKMNRKLKLFMKQYNQGVVTLEHINQCIQSWLGHAKHANCYNLRKVIFNGFKLTKEYSHAI